MLLREWSCRRSSRWPEPWICTAAEQVQRSCRRQYGDLPDGQWDAYKRPFANDFWWPTAMAAPTASTCRFIRAVSPAAYAAAARSGRLAVVPRLRPVSVCRAMEHCHQMVEQLLHVPFRQLVDHGRCSRRGRRSRNWCERDLETSFGA